MTDEALSRTWRIHAIGGPEQLRLDPLPLPEPGPGEVRLRVLSCGLNRSDLLWIGGLSFLPTPPAKVGYEVCGIVERLGPGVSGFVAGDRVSNLITFFIGDYAHFADYTVLPADCLVHTPQNLSHAQGAAFCANYLTNYCGLIEFADIRPWQHLLITAGSSANGMTAIPVARKAGATVIATTRKASRRSLLLDAGAHHVIVTGEEDLPARVAEITGGHGCELIYDCVAGQMTPLLLRCVAVNGHWVQYGYLDPTPVQVNWTEWFHRQPRLSFYSVPQYSGLSVLGMPGRPEALARARRFILQGVAEGSLPVPIAREFQGIEAVPEALRSLEANLGGGKIVVSF